MACRHFLAQVIKNKWSDASLLRGREKLPHSSSLVCSIAKDRFLKIQDKEPKDTNTFPYLPLSQTVLPFPEELSCCTFSFAVLGSIYLLFIMELMYLYLLY